MSKINEQIKDASENQDVFVTPIDKMSVSEIGDALSYASSLGNLQTYCCIVKNGIRVLEFNFMSDYREYCYRMGYMTRS